MNINISPEQFKQLVIALEHRNLTMGYVESQNIDESMDEVPEEIAAKIHDFELLQHAIYSGASEYGMQDMFEVQEDSNLLALKSDTPLEAEVWDSVDDMEKIVTYEMLVRHFVIQESQEMRQADMSEESFQEDYFPLVIERSKKLWKYFQEKGLDEISIKNEI